MLDNRNMQTVSLSADHQHQHDDLVSELQLISDGSVSPSLTRANKYLSKSIYLKQQTE